MKYLFLPLLVAASFAGCATTKPETLTPEEVEQRQERQEARAFFHEPRLRLPER